MHEGRTLGALTGLSHRKATSLYTRPYANVGSDGGGYGSSEIAQRVAGICSVRGVYNRRMGVAGMSKGNSEYFV